MWLRDSFPARYPGPSGGVNADGRVVEVAGLRIAGLGGSIRYNDGQNQWTERQQARRAARLVRAARKRPVDVLLTHSPPLGVGDRDDPPHRGFACLHTVVDQLKPAVLVHGHIHPHGMPVPDRRMGETRVLNTVGYRILDLP
jgi:Icc-related predicted phosphoesterase